MPLISVLIPTFNQHPYIAQAIRSALDQDYPDIEYIVVDGSSTDGSLDIIKEYEQQIATLISEPDKNLYDAINKGMKAATGDVVGLIHAGDRLFDGQVIGKIADHFNTNDIDVMYGHT